MQFKELQKMVDSCEEKETNSVRIIDLFDPLAMQKIITCLMQRVDSLDKENQRLKAKVQEAYDEGRNDGFEDGYSQCKFDRT